MSLELHIFMQDPQVPSQTAWQKAITQAGFPTVFGTPLDLRLDSSSRPVSYKGLSTGFEFDLGPAADILTAYSHLIPKVGSRDRCATFRWGGDPVACAAALSAAAALTKLTDGIYFYPNDDILYGADVVVEMTRRDLNSI